MRLSNLPILARLLSLASLLALPAAFAAPAAPEAPADFLAPDQAFQLQVAPEPGTEVLGLTLTAAPGYHLYQERFRIQAEPPLTLPPAEIPAGRKAFDANFGRDMALWEGSVKVRQPLPAGAAVGRLQVTYQGCADAGLCYPPARGHVVWERTPGGGLTARWLGADAEAAGGVLATATGATSPGASAMTRAPAAQAATAAPAPQGGQPAGTGGVSVGATAEDGGTGALMSGSLLKVVGMFLVGGLLLSFTPCVLPMLPILSSIIVGQDQPVSRARGFGLAVAYSLGMALVYTTAGVLAGLVGSGFAAALQNPWVLGSFALLLSGLALSMFGVWEFQMPGFIQERVNNASNRLGGGRHLAVFAMGGLSALLVGPCVAAPLAGALVYISQTRDVLLGGAALFALATGMSVPLLLLGLSAGSLLPRAGRWMVHVKSFFGVLLLAVALWLVSPVLPIPVVMAVAGGGALVLLVALGGFEAGRAKVARGVSLVLGLWAVALLAGAFSGGNSLLQPLAHLAAGPAAAAPVKAGPSFQRITRLDELDQALRSAGRPVMLDLYADWCVACKEMEHLTFSEPAVRARMDQALLLQADVTADTPEAKALMKRFGLFGPPAVLFFDAQGQEIAAARTIGFENAERFARRLDAARL